ncbi:MAG: TIGR01777 family protein [Planctomycetes bacterium]|nr:TIGR01777 family protein [Planctomycetota bacterium]
MTVAVSGSTGLIGTALVRQLKAAGHTVKPILRHKPDDPTTAIHWDQAHGSIDAGAFAGVDAVVHLAGESIIGRWTESKRQRIRDSRVNGTALLSKALASLDPAERPGVLVSASATGYYGDRGDTELNDDAGPGKAGDGFLSEVCIAWEAAADPARDAGLRVVHPRIGMVLAREGGALPTMLPAFRFGLGGTLGSGRQWVGWIHLDDLAGALNACVQDDRLQGPVNAVAPHPVTNQQMTQLLGKVLGRPTILPVPAFGAKLVFGELAEELLLASARVLPRKLESVGFDFSYPTMEAALRDLLDKPHEQAA